MKKSRRYKSQKVRRSLNTNLFFITVFPLILVCILGGALGFYIQKKDFMSHMERTFSMEADTKALEFNSCFDSAMRAVNSMSEYILNTIDEKRMLTDKAYSTDYMNTLETVLGGFAKTASNSVCVYFRMNMETYGPIAGIFLSGNNRSGYIKVANTDLSLYSPSDELHVGWYYLPQWEGRAIWQSPYEAPGINMHVFSYVNPLYKDGEFLGVVGIDLSMAALKNLVDSIERVGMTGLLLGKDYELIYSPATKSGYNVDARLNLQSLRRILENASENDINEFTWGGEENYGIFRELQNGMKFVIMQPKTAIQDWRRIRAIIGIIVFAAFIGVLIFRFSHSGFLEPVASLTEASYRLARGELGIPISYKSENELGLLADNLRKMSDQLVEYIDYIREQAESEREAKESAINASKAKSNFLANMSHEIRTPINAVLGMNEMILRETQSDEIRKYALNIKSAGNTLLSLINDVLDFSKIESGKMEILSDTYELSSVLMDLITIISERAEKSGLKLNLQINPNIPSRLYGDSMRLKQCILNLLTNAVKYTPKGSVTFIVDYEEVPYSDGKQIHLTVKVCDTGIGIKPEDLERLFQPFERIEESRNRTVEGTGLGLNIVKSILDGMGSKLEVQSEYGKGSVFYFSILQPVVSAEPIGDIIKNYEEKVHERELYEEHLFAPEAKLLFVDDTVMNLEVVKGLLKNTMIQVDTVLSGAEALEAVAKTEYDILFIDHRMPNMDGIETLEAMRKMPDNLCKEKPCIALTANAINGAKEMYLEAGFTDYLSKPVSSENLEEMIRYYLPKGVVLSAEQSEAWKKVHGAGTDAGLQGTEGGSFAGSPNGSGAGGAAEKDASSLLKDGVDGIDLQTARTYCGSDDLVVKMLGMFQSSTEKSAQEIQDFLQAGDLEQYIIRVHSVKSSARTVGAIALSEQAAVLEAAAVEKDTEKLTLETPAFLELYRSYTEKLRAFSQNIARPVHGTGTRPREPLKEGELEKYLKALEEDCKNQKLSSLEKTVGELQMRELPVDFKESFYKIRDLVKDVNFGALSEVLSELL